MTTSFDDWLRSNKGLQQLTTGDGRSYYKMTGDDARSTLDDTFAGQLRGIHTNLSTPDDSGRLPYGTDLLGVMPGFIDPTNNTSSPYLKGQVGGQDVMRLGTNYNPSGGVDKYFQQYGVTPEMFQYDQGQGYYMTPENFQKYSDAMNTYNKSTDDNAMTYMGAMAAMAGGFGALNGAFPTSFEGSPFQNFFSSLQNLGQGIGGNASGGGMDLFDWITDVPDFTDTLNGMGIDNPFTLPGLPGATPPIKPDVWYDWPNSAPSSLPDWMRNLPKQVAQTLLGNGTSPGVLNGGGVSDMLSLPMRLAPGLAALGFAQNQTQGNTDPLSNMLTPNPEQYMKDTFNKYNSGGFDNQFDLSKFNDIYGNASQLGRAFDTSGISEVMSDAGGLKRPFDTSQFNSLYNQAGNITNPLTSSSLANYDLQSGQARNNLLSNLSQRGVMGSSFGNMDIGNFETQNAAQRGMLEGNLGLQGVAAQRGIAQDLMGAQNAQRGYEQAGLGIQGNMANSLLGAQESARGFENAGLQTQLQAANAMQQAEQMRRQLGLQALSGQSGLANNYYNTQSNLASQLTNANMQNKAIQSALYGRAFDVLGRAVSPSVYGR